MSSSGLQDRDIFISKGSINNDVGKKLNTSDTKITVGDVQGVIYDKDENARGLGHIQVAVPRGDGHGIYIITAKPFDAHCFTCPVPGERVYCFKDDVSRNWYYTGILPIDGQLNWMFGAKEPAFKKGTDEFFHGAYFDPQPDGTRTLDVIEGDFCLQSRYGSSISMRHTNPNFQRGWNKNLSTMPTPILIIRNSGYLPYEDFAWDGNSIWLTSDQFVELPNKVPFGSMSDNEKDNYGKTQTLMYSDRMVVMTRHDEIILNSPKSVQFHTPNWAHDVDAVLDNVSEMTSLLSDLTKEIKTLAQTHMKQTFTVPGIGTTGPSSQLATYSTSYSKVATIESNLRQVINNIDRLKQK